MTNKPTEQELWTALERQVDAGEFSPKTHDDEPPLSSDPDFVFESLRTELAEALVRAMESARLNENQLARKLGVTRQAVNEVLNMTTNMTLKSLAKFCVALDRLPILSLLAPGDRIEIKQASRARIVSVSPEPRTDDWKVESEVESVAHHKSTLSEAQKNTCPTEVALSA